MWFQNRRMKWKRARGITHQNHKQASKSGSSTGKVSSSGGGFYAGSNFGSGTGINSTYPHMNANGEIMDSYELDDGDYDDDDDDEEDDDDDDLEDDDDDGDECDDNTK